MQGRLRGALIGSPGLLWLGRSLFLLRKITHGQLERDGFGQAFGNQRRYQILRSVRMK
jgi:hypothetical protein